MDPIWYLGPLGDLRALTCPSPGIAVTDVRYGGVHQGLSGARTMDVTGHRAQYQFDWKFVEDAEWKWLRALHTRHIPGPFRLINPMRKNRLSHQATALDPRALTIPSASRTWVVDWPAGAEVGYRSVRLTGWGNEQNTVSFDLSKTTAIFPGESVTGSTFVKGDAAASARLGIEYYDRAGVKVGPSSFATINITTGWQRFTISRVALAGAVSLVFAFRGDTFTTPVQLAAPQLEAGAAATPWEQGGGAPVVVVDQLTTTSPRFPLSDCSLTLLEV